MVLNPESKIEYKAVQELLELGAWVTKLNAAPGVPLGAPDRMFVYGEKWAVIEFKRDAKAPFRIGQKIQLDRLKKMNPFVYVVYPENWEEVKAELIAKFF